MTKPPATANGVTPSRQAHHRPAATGRIRLFVCDIDGCLSRGSTHSFDPRLLSALQESNRRAQSGDADWPAITFCTGRTMPYVECLVQATGGFTPALCENGSVLFDPIRYEIITHPALGDNEMELLGRMRGLIDDRLIREGVQHEHGKFSHFTLVVAPPIKPDDLVPIANELAGGEEFGGKFVVESTKACVHVLFRHLHKGTGIHWLVEKTGIAASEMAGIGDARPDLPFLKQVGIACAPANAHPDVAAAATWTSDRHDAEAALEFLSRVVEHNRAVREAELPVEEGVA